MPRFLRIYNNFKSLKMKNINQFNQQSLNNKNISPDQTSQLFQKYDDHHQQYSKHQANNMTKNGQINEQKSKKWTTEQENLFFELYQEKGSKWAEIAHMIGRKQNDVKNKFYCSLRKLLRKLANFGKKSSTKKVLTYDAIIRPLEALQTQAEIYEGFQAERRGIKSSIIQICKQSIEKLDRQSAKNLIDRVHKFNYQTRSYNLKITRNSVKQQKVTKIKVHKEIQAMNQNQESFEISSIVSSNLLWSQDRLLDDQEIEKVFQLMNKCQKNQKNLIIQEQRNPYQQNIAQKYDYIFARDSDNYFAF